MSKGKCVLNLREGIWMQDCKDRVNPSSFARVPLQNAFHADKTIQPVQRYFKKRERDSPYPTLSDAIVCGS